MTTTTTTTTTDVGSFVIVRTRDSGCFAGHLTHGVNDKVGLTGARRLWYWDGAASLSELAARGTSKPGNCKFPPPVDITVFGVMEIIRCTPDAQTSIEAVPEWTAH